MISRLKRSTGNPLILVLSGLLVATIGCSLGGLPAEAPPAPSPTPLVVVLTPTPLPNSVLAEASVAQQVAVNIY